LVVHGWHVQNDAEPVEAEIVEDDHATDAPVEEVAEVVTDEDGRPHAASEAGNTVAPNTEPTPEPVVAPPVVTQPAQQAA